MIRGVSAVSQKMRQVLDAIMGNSHSILESTLSSLDPTEHMPGITFEHLDYLQFDGEDHDHEEIERIMMLS